MSIPLAERMVRASLPLIRLLQRVMPLRTANRFLKRSVAHIRPGAEVMHEAVNADGVHCEWIIPKGSHTGQVLLYLHGGGFVFRLTPQHIKMGAYLAQALGFRILMVDYRTAPAHPFPAPLDDCLTAYHWLLNQGISAKDIVVAGDSAGGNLSVALMMKLRDTGSPLPAAAACLSPAVDLTPKNNSDKDFKDKLLPPKAMKFYRESYIGKDDPHNPLISPIFGNLDNLSPLLIHVGEDEILREEAIRLTNRAKSAGVDVQLEIYPRMWHVWQIFLSLPQATQSLDGIARFFKEKMGLG